jgi:hypothetical protein
LVTKTKNKKEEEGERNKTLKLMHSGGETPLSSAAERTGGKREREDKRQRRKE